jgi:hypothetical protein
LLIDAPSNGVNGVTSSLTTYDAHAPLACRIVGPAVSSDGLTPGIYSGMYKIADAVPIDFY